MNNQIIEKEFFLKKRNYKKNNFKLDESIFSFYKSPKTLKDYIF